MKQDDIQPSPEAIIDLMDSPTDIERVLIKKAYKFAEQSHKGQSRYSGEDYFVHTFGTAKHLALLGMGSKVIAAGFIHDTIEDTGVGEETIRKEFGDEILFLIQSVTKLSKLRYHGLKRHAESLRKLLIATAEDVRVLIIKLADRLHNMETLEHVPNPEKRERIASETLEIYAPLAHKLGIGKIRGQLEDLAFPYVYPEEYEHTKKLLKSRSRENIKRLEVALKDVKRRLAENNITITKTSYRIKKLYSLYKKLERYDKNIDEIRDIAALRIIVPTAEDCYRALGVIHNVFHPLPGAMKDYIATPKINGYRSLHTNVFTGDGGIIEIQIRTPEMHREAQYGVASHVAYKERAWQKDSKEQHKVTWGKPSDSTQDKPAIPPYAAPPWMQKLIETQEGVSRPREFLKNLRTDLFVHRVFVFTPKGEVIDLPTGASPIDFAYAIHTDIGDHLSGSKINGKMSAIGTKLKSGDIVEITTKESSRPTHKWLGLTKTNLAKKKIRAVLQVEGDQKIG